MLNLVNMKNRPMILIGGWINYYSFIHTFNFIKVSKFQNHFFLKLHSTSRILSNISFVFVLFFVNGVSRNLLTFICLEVTWNFEIFDWGNAIMVLRIAFLGRNEKRLDLKLNRLKKLQSLFSVTYKAHVYLGTFLSF